MDIGGETLFPYVKMEKCINDVIKVQPTVRLEKLELMFSDMKN